MEKPTQNEFYKKRFRKLGAFLTAITALSALGLMSLLLIYGENGYMELKKVRQERERLQREGINKQERNDTLSQEIQRLKTDPEAIEKVAREELNLAKPGEVVIKLSDKQKKETPNNTETEESKP